MMKIIEDKRGARPPFAPPFLKAGKLVIAQTANILFYLGPRLNLSPRDEAGRLWAHQLQLTITDLVVEIHDTHHPITSGSTTRSSAGGEAAHQDFWRYRVPKFLGYFERVLQKNGGKYLVGRRLSYIDLSLFQIVEGLRYAFPKRMKRFEKKIPGLVALHDRVAQRPRIKAYLASERRIPFSANGAFTVTSRSWIAEHDLEKACPGLDREWKPVSRLREARFGGLKKVRKDHAPITILERVNAG